MHSASARAFDRPPVHWLPWLPWYRHDSAHQTHQDSSPEGRLRQGSDLARAARAANWTRTTSCLCLDRSAILADSSSSVLPMTLWESCPLFVDDASALSLWEASWRPCRSLQLWFRWWKSDPVMGRHVLCTASRASRTSPLSAVVGFSTNTHQRPQPQGCHHQNREVTPIGKAAVSLYTPPRVTRHTARPRAQVAATLCSSLTPLYTHAGITTKLLRYQRPRTKLLITTS